MKLNLHFLNIFKESFGKKHRSGLTQYMNPLRDWAIGLSLATFVLIFGTGFIGFDFYKQFVAPQEEVKAPSKPAIYSEKETKEYAEKYMKKEVLFNALRNEKPSIPVIVPIVNKATTTASKAPEPLAKDGSGQYTSPTLSQ